MLIFTLETFFNFLNQMIFGVGYIQSSNLFPEPLSSEEEKKYLREMLEGNEKARNILIEHNLRLVAHIAKKYNNTKIDQEDLISIGTIGLIKGINSFNADKNIKLATYTARCIENEILMFLRKTSKTKSEMSLDEPLNVDWEGNVLLLSDVLGTDSDIIYKDMESEAERDILLLCFEKLSPREKEIVKMRFGILGAQKKTQKEIADIMGISQSYISRLEKKVMKKLKKEISKFEQY